MASVTINGRSFVGRSVNVVNGTVFVDGVKVEAEDAKTINISVTGDVDKLQVDSCESLRVTGSVGTASVVSGYFRCGDVAGSVSSVSGDVQCGNVGGTVSTVSGDVIRN